MLCFGFSLFSIPRSSHLLLGITLWNSLDPSASLRVCFLEELKWRQLVLNVTLESRLSALDSEMGSPSSETETGITWPVVSGMVMTFAAGVKWEHVEMEGQALAYARVPALGTYEIKYDEKDSGWHVLSALESLKEENIKLRLANCLSRACCENQKALMPTFKKTLMSCS